MNTSNQISPKEHLGRFGHSMVSPVMRRLNSNLSSIPEGDLSLHQVATVISFMKFSEIIRPSLLPGGWLRREALILFFEVFLLRRPNSPLLARYVAL